ncbi:hypothetical protein [Nocardia lijiangensis]|uniref:hypothetical protein n=1 Tax=Nocardia lijiangensis TaxID=299618 RepID=UPI000833D3A2|nr:hypothetical protein [Nocardia lijiangensis]
MFEADVQELGRLSGTVNSVAEEIDKIDVRTSGNKLAEALPGCPVGPACVQSGEFIEGAWMRISQRLQELSTLVWRTAGEYQITDEQFKQRLNRMDFQVRGER